MLNFFMFPEPVLKTEGASWMRAETSPRDQRELQLPSLQLLKTSITWTENVQRQKSTCMQV